jgi:hypothetical protein
MRADWSLTARSTGMIRFGTSAGVRHQRAIADRQSQIDKQSNIKLQKSPIRRVRA